MWLSCCSHSLLWRLPFGQPSQAQSSRMSIISNVGISWRSTGPVSMPEPTIGTSPDSRAGPRVIRNTQSHREPLPSPMMVESGRAKSGTGQATDQSRHWVCVLPAQNLIQQTRALSRGRSVFRHTKFSAMTAGSTSSGSVRSRRTTTGFLVESYTASLRPHSKQSMR